MATALALATLLAACAPRVGPRTLTAIISVESGGNPNAIHDNTSGLSYFPHSANRAAQLATALVDDGHSLDLGLSQINSTNLPGMGMSVSDMFDPCTNVRISARILTQDYHRAVAHFGPGQTALRHAIGAYNTGSIFAGHGYTALVLAAAEHSYENYNHVIANITPHIHRIAVSYHPPRREARYQQMRLAPASPTESANFTVDAVALR